MKKYLIKRLLTVIPVLFVVSLLIFSLVHLAPGSPAQAILGDQASTEDVARLAERMGLNDPLPAQYFRWLGGLFRGDLGVSYGSGEPVATLLKNSFLPTVNLAVYAMLISLALALPLGMLAARFRGSWGDAAISVLSLAAISVPSFLVALGLMVLFCVRIRWFPLTGYVPWSGGALEHIRSLTLPAVALGLMYAALIVRMTRSSMLEALNSDYIKMAKAKGVRAGGIVGRHAFRNALVNVLTVIGQSFIGTFSGAAVIETIFNIPGVGQLMVSSIGKRDYAVIQAIVLLVALINVLINLAVDLLYGLIDPRIRVS